MYGAAAAYILNGEGQLLIVKPNYRADWLLPGGMIEPGESPKEACFRECLEELGLEVEVRNLLCLEVRKANSSIPETMRFIFECEFSSKGVISLQAEELDAYRYVTLEKAVKLLDASTVRRLRHMQNHDIYFET